MTQAAEKFDELLPQPGTVQILNVGEGDLTLSFDKKNPEEVERARKIIEDMLKRGYALLVQVGTKKGIPVYQRATGFDPKTCEYIVASSAEESVDIGKEIEGMRTTASSGKPSKRKTKTRVPADKTRAVSVARTAGG